ncbi:hypothetical protein B0H15DRAFT_573167 [Mycena belliarum]|uniref:Uncharacterized protein n=1 Tax=Mycena belliarum TaxID=1033014 RepID=A0AAD6TWD2_9AGAR|nr:hypothetical protein B0H15DRAFT_573167 [Mycena belliae]
MSSNDGTATPRAKTQDETETVRTAIGAMSQSLVDLEQSFSTLNEKSAALSTTGPSVQDAMRDLETLRKEMREQGAKGDKDIQKFKQTAGDVKTQIAANLRNEILEQIRMEIAAQVKLQVDLQIQEQIPVSLSQQSLDNKTQLQIANTSLANSAARKKNAGLRIQNLDESLAPVLRSDGTKGKLFPADLRSLLSYDSVHVRELVKDYELFDDDVREVNLNRFLGHIGILFEVVVV